jgi:putative DNA primase/helicase
LILRFGSRPAVQLPAGVTVTIPDDKQDKQLPDKLRAELPGILAWAVRGCIDWQSNGLGEPSEVTIATAAYRAGEDILADFLTECCIQKPEVKATTETLFEAYRTYTGDPSTSRTQFGKALTERGFAKKKINGKTWRVGLAIVSQETDTISQSS